MQASIFVSWCAMMVVESILRYWMQVGKGIGDYQACENAPRASAPVSGYSAGSVPAPRSSLLFPARSPLKADLVVRYLIGLPGSVARSSSHNRSPKENGGRNEWLHTN